MSIQLEHQPRNLSRKESEILERLGQSPEKPLLIMGPCSLSSLDQGLAIGRELIGQVDMMRANYWKPRTSPIDGRGNLVFQGVGLNQGLQWYDQIKQRLPGLSLVSEVAVADDIEPLSQNLDMVWVGARGVSPATLPAMSQACGRAEIPLMVKNPLQDDLDAFVGSLLHARHANETLIGLNQGDSSRVIVACLRGVPSDNQDWRNIPNWDWIPALKQCGFGVIVDPSHLLTKDEIDPIPKMRDLILEAQSFGADGYMIEVNHPDHISLSDPGVPVHAMLNELAKMAFISGRNI